jgi:hypothetical protein
MGLLSRAADTIYALRFLRLLTMPWEKTAAYKQGLIDEKGKVIKKPVSGDQKAAYTYFHKLVFNIRRLMGKMPGASLTSYAAALYLVKEATGMSEKSITETMEKMGVSVTDHQLKECFYVEEGNLIAGFYHLVKDVADPITGDVIAAKGTRIRVTENLEPVDTVFNANIYQVTHMPTTRKIMITAGDILR